MFAHGGKKLGAVQQVVKLNSGRYNSSSPSAARVAKKRQVPNDGGQDMSITPQELMNRVNATGWVIAPDLGLITLTILLYSFVDGARRR